MPGEGRPTISDELTSGKPCKRQTSIRPGAAILGGCILLCDVRANALKQFRNTGAIRRASSSSSMFQRCVRNFSPLPIRHFIMTVVDIQILNIHSTPRTFTHLFIKKFKLQNIAVSNRLILDKKGRLLNSFSNRYVLNGSKDEKNKNTYLPFLCAV